MSDSTTTLRQELADAFGGDLDPLEEYAPTFERMDIDPFDLFVADVLDPEEPAKSTRQAYMALFDQWRENMDEQGRHPACPNESHVHEFARYLQTDRGNVPRTIKLKLNRLNRVFEYWQNDPTFPHPREYNPFPLAKSKLSLANHRQKTPPRIPLDELRSFLAEETHIRNRVILSLQMKLGLRASEVCNIKLEDIKIANSPLSDHYRELGTADPIQEYQNCIYIPTRYERDGNKSYLPRVLPLDDELQRLLTQCLLMRPDADRPWALLSLSNHTQLTDSDINYVWKNVFRPEYDETEEHRGVTSHFGRHYFTTYWKVDRDLNRELIKYMRGDKIGNGRQFDETMDAYVHTYFEDIQDVYLDEIFKLNI